MFIGINNRLNLKLVEEINQVIYVQIVDYKEFLKQKTIHEKVSSKTIFVNLIDIGIDERLVYHHLKGYYPHAKIVALHYYQVPKMTKQTLEMGYDAYLSIFEFSEKLHEVLKHLSTNLPTE